MGTPRAGSSPVIRIKKDPNGSFFHADGDIEPGFNVSASLRSAHNRHPPDVLRPVIRTIAVGQAFRRNACMHFSNKKDPDGSFFHVDISHQITYA